MKRNKKNILLKALAPFLLLAAMVVGCYFWLFAPKGYETLVPANARAVVEMGGTALTAKEGPLAQWWETTGFYPEGLDETQRALIFISPDEYFGLAAAVKDNRQLGAYVQRMVNAGNATLLPRSEQLAWAWTEKGWLMAWNNTSFLLMGPATLQEQDALRQSMARLFRAGAAASYRHADWYDTFSRQEGDARIFVTANVLPSPFGLLLRSGAPAEADPEQLLLLGGLKAEKTAKGYSWTMEGSLYGADEETRELIASGNKAPQTITSIYPANTEDNTLLFLAAHSYGDELLQLLRTDEQMRSMLLDLDKPIDAAALQQRGGDFTLAMTAFPKEGQATFGLAITRGDSVDYYCQTANMPESTNGKLLQQEATGLRTYLRLNLQEMQRQPGLQDGAAEIIRRLFGKSEWLTWRTEANGTIRLTID